MRILGKKLGLVVNLSLSISNMKDEHIQLLQKVIINKVLTHN